jgi:uncharacterized heparinase superfamily protein
MTCYSTFDLFLGATDLRGMEMKQFSASMWSADEAAQIRSIAKNINPDIKTHAIPHGLQVERGPDAIVEHLLEVVPPLLEQP